MAKQVIVSCCLFALLPIITLANSAEFIDGLQQAKQVAPILQQQAYQRVQSFDPQKIFNHYDDHPSQANFYQGTTQIHIEDMQKEATRQKASNEVAKTVDKNIHTRLPDKTIVQSPEIQQGLQVQKEADAVIHRQGNYYCLEGDCVDDHYQPSGDFEKALSSLSSTNSATKDFDSHRMFKGYSAECREVMAHFSNCCEEKGWGQDINLAHCSDREKNLGIAREKKVAVYVGSYCSKRVVKQCVEHKQTYCVFDSKIARVIQEKGRKNQLHIDFGNAKQAQCQGITPTQLQRIDLSKINFGQDIIQDLKSNIKSQDIVQIQSLINQHITQLQTGKSYD